MSGGDDSKLPGRTSSKDDSMFSGRGAPAFMSQKEPAIRLLRERYSESFAIVPGTENRIHLFLVKVGLWALVRTFVPKDLASSTDTISLEDLLGLIENALLGIDPLLLASLDASVEKAKSRIANKTKQFRVRSQPD
jgi:hypothetical protein